MVYSIDTLFPTRFLSSVADDISHNVYRLVRKTNHHLVGVVVLLRLPSQRQYMVANVDLLKAAISDKLPYPPSLMDEKLVAEI